MTYQERKENIRQKAIEWQLGLDEVRDELDSENFKTQEWFNTWNEYFARKGRQYGLLKEFKENGII